MTMGQPVDPEVTAESGSRQRSGLLIGLVIGAVIGVAIGGLVVVAALGGSSDDGDGLVSVSDDRDPVGDPDPPSDREQATEQASPDGPQGSPEPGQRVSHLPWLSFEEPAGTWRFGTSGAHGGRLDGVRVGGSAEHGYAEIEARIADELTDLADAILSVRYDIAAAGDEVIEIFRDGEARSVPGADAGVEFVVAVRDGSEHLLVGLLFVEASGPVGATGTATVVGGVTMTFSDIPDHGDYQGALVEIDRLFASVEVDPDQLLMEGSRLLGDEIDR